jgi:hypothetical protein
VAATALAAPVPDQPASVSALSPFSATCGLSGQNGTNYRDTEIEPWADINPKNPDNIVAGHQQDRWSNGGSRGLVARVSKDGGTTWSAVVIPKISLCSGGAYDRATDPWLSFAPDGGLYFMSFAFNQDLPTGGSGANAMLVSRSKDGGSTWSDPVPLITDTDPQFSNDKNAITADPNDARFAYAVWDRLQDFTVGSKGRSADLGPSQDGVAMARARIKKARAAYASGSSPVNQPALQFKGPAYIARTTTGGRSWEKARAIYDPGLGNQTIGNQVIVRPNGAVIDFFTEIVNTAPGVVVNLAFLTSNDKGATFGFVSRAAAIISDGTLTPDTHDPVRDGSGLFDVAVDPNNGNLYAVWQDRRFNNVEQVAFAMSTDGGTTWSRPVHVDKAPANRNKLREQAFIPSVAVAGDGTVVVTYYDFRYDDETVEGTDHWAVFCSSACDQGSSWGQEVRLTGGSFDMLQAPLAGGRFLGDYMALAISGSTVRPIFGITDGASETSLVTRPVTLSGGAAAR